MPYSITREDAERDAGAIRSALDLLRAVGTNTSAAVQLTDLAGSIEEQVTKPTVVEPREFGSVVLVVYRNSRETRWCRTYSIPVDQPWCTGNHMGSWADVVEGATDVEVLRIGVGAEEAEQISGEAYNRGAADVVRQAVEGLRAKRAEAITAERQDAYRIAMQIVEALA